MKLKLRFSALGIILLFSCMHNGSGFGLSPSKAGISALISFGFGISNFHALPSRPQRPQFFHRVGPTSQSVEDESEEDENESQARVEPQITPLNRDECLAKLLCGMSVPVTGTGAPKNGYYSEYSKLVGKFFEAFPLEEEEKSIESMEAYDDYSAEDDHPAKGKDKVPARQNSKVKKPAEAEPSGLELIDISPKSGNSTGNTTTVMDRSDDDEREGRSYNDPRLSRARKIVAKLGEKLQTVRECQKISGCPFTFKQLRSKLKSTPTISSNVPLTTQSIKYNYNEYKPIRSRPRPSPTTASTTLTLGSPVEAYKDPHKGDDELEEFFGPPPVFGANKRPINYQYGQQRPTPGQQYYQSQHSEEYIPYDPPVRGHGQGQAQTHGPGLRPAFPKKKVSYKLPSYIKGKPQGENDEFDDVNQSTGPVSMIGADHGESGAGLIGQKVQKQNGQGQIASQTQTEEFVKDTQQSNDGGSEDGDYNDDGSDEDYDDDYEDDYEEEEEDEESKEEEEDKKSKKKNTVSNDEAPATTPKSKIKNYKNPGISSSQLVFIEEEFGPKKPSEDDEKDHPDNAWTKLAFATSGALIKEPAIRNKTPLEEKNDEKLNLSKASDEDENEDKKDESQESDEDEDEDDARSRITQKTKPAAVAKKESDDDEAEEEKSRRRKPSKSKRNKVRTKLTLNDEDEFEKIGSIWDSSPTPKRKSSKPRRKSESSKDKKRSGSKPAPKDKKKKPEPKSEEDSDEEEPKKKTPPPQLLQIGGRPLVPQPERETKQSKKTSTLSRFKFNLVTPYGSGQENPTRQRTTLQVPDLSMSYMNKKPSNNNNNNEGSSYKKEPMRSSFSSHKESSSPSYIPTSFGTSNNQHSNVEFIQPQTSTQKNPGMITFPFGSPLSTFTNLFKRPSKGQDIPGPTGNPLQIAAAAFVPRPVGPESNQFKRVSTPGSGSGGGKSRSDRPKYSKKGKKSKNKKSGRY